MNNGTVRYTTSRLAIALISCMFAPLAVPFLLIPINIVAPHGGVVVIIYK